jgi:hypothetical protein
MAADITVFGAGNYDIEADETEEQGLSQIGVAIEERDRDNQGAAAGEIIEKGT